MQRPTEIKDKRVKVALKSQGWQIQEEHRYNAPNSTIWWMCPPEPTLAERMREIAKYLQYGEQAEVVGQAADALERADKIAAAAQHLRLEAKAHHSLVDARFVGYLTTAEDMDELAAALDAKP